MTDDDVFLRHRGLVFAIAYDLLGSVADADDVVQDVYERWVTRPGDVTEPRAYLARAATNRALDILRSSERRRVEYVGPWLPEPLPSGAPSAAGAPGPEDRAVEAEAVSAALLVLLQSLAEHERVCYTLREVFGFSYAEVAQVVGGQEAAVRQAVHRARQRVQERRERFAVDPAQHAGTVQRFLAAAGEGDIDGLLELLAPGAVLTVDGGGLVTAARRPVVGAEKIARFLVGLRGTRGPDGRVVPAVLNDELAAVAVEGGAVVATFQFAVAGGAVEELYVVRNPHKLARLDDLVRP
jgi:RNA polymerase sigma-70 factor (ECF subfamily)